MKGTVIGIGCAIGLLAVGPAGVGAASELPSSTPIAVEEAALDPAGATALFREANALYADGRYDEAASRYERLIDSGFGNADVRYNLGNAYYKLGEIGKAILWYERALRLDPEDEDARANLALARELIADRQTAVEGPLTELLEPVAVRLTPGRLTASACISYWVLVLLLVAGVLRGGTTGWLGRAAGIAAVVMVVSGALLAVRLVQSRATVEAVVLAKEVAVRTGPGEDFVLEFKLHEGTKVRLREERGEWVRISVAGSDLEGWLPAAAVEEI